MRGLRLVLLVLTLSVFTQGAQAACTGYTFYGVDNEGKCLDVTARCKELGSDYRVVYNAQGDAFVALRPKYGYGVLMTPYSPTTKECELSCCETQAEADAVYANTPAGKAAAEAAAAAAGPAGPIDSTLVRKPSVKPHPTTSDLSAWFPVTVPQQCPTSNPTAGSPFQFSNGTNKTWANITHGGVYAYSVTFKWVVTEAGKGQLPSTFWADIWATNPPVTETSNDFRIYYTGDVPLQLNNYNSTGTAETFTIYGQTHLRSGAEVHMPRVWTSDTENKWCVGISEASLKLLRADATKTHFP